MYTMDQDTGTRPDGLPAAVARDGEHGAEAADRRPGRWWVRHRLRRLRERDLPVTLELWNGVRVPLGETSRATLKVRAPAGLLDLLHPSLDRLAEAYVAGRLDIDGPIDVIARLGIDLARGGIGGGERPRRPWRFSRHTRASDAEAIGRHYDVSNRFYAQFLDENMVYSCAYYRREDASLERAQFDKLEHVCLKLGLRPGMRLLDIGCGWGALAVHAARRFGVSVVGITISPRQHALARDRVATAGLHGQVEVRLQDYRDLPGDERFDRIVSIGMFEHVGIANLPDYFTRIERALVPGGLALNHGITTSSADGRRVGHGAGRFIERHVFPNGELPHVSGAIGALAGAGLELVDAESLRRHYARTLRAWSERFESRLPRLQAIAGERRTRVWRIYLAGCALGFEHGWVNVYQLLVAKPSAEGARIDLPMTREYMYAP